MKRSLVAVALLAAQPALAGNPWISRFDGLQGQIVEIRPDHSAVRVTNAYPTARGESATQVAIIAAFSSGSSERLLLFDKATRKMIGDWQIALKPEMRIGGSSSDIVLSGGAAFFLMYAVDSDPAATIRNSRGGIFSLMRLDLRTGETIAMPLDDAFWRPQLLDLDGVPVIAEWRRGAMARLSPDGRSLSPVFARGGLADEMSAEAAETVWSTHYPCAEFVAVPGVGVFRQSKTGRLQRVTDATLQPVSGPAESIALGAVNRTQLLLAATSATGPAIAVIRQIRDHRVLSFIDATTLATLWERRVDEGAYIWATAAAGPDAILFVDRDDGRVVRLSRTGREVLHQLPADSYFSHARLMSAGTP